MSNDNQNMNDPLAFLRSMWSGMGVSMPGMVTPTFDVDELEKRITDMKAVEGWLRMNLSMLQMTIQGLEMQRTTLGAVQAMSKMASESARSMAPEPAPKSTPEPAQAAPAAAVAEPEKNALSDAAMWPWQMMQQIREQMQQSAEAVEQAASEKKPAAKKAPARRTTK
ncbi:MAG: PhaM family polyhydroxyalkanoate granule multifunctional regulatory protein [Azonexus sp.]